MGVGAPDNDTAVRLGSNRAAVPEDGVLTQIARNQDDHTKNIGYVMRSDGVWSLSPAYDMTYSNNPESLWTSRHQMTLNGKQADIGLDDRIFVAEAADVRKARRVVAEVAEAVGQWDRFASESEVPHQFGTEIRMELRPDINTGAVGT
jgi:serine/threonine-protein kinase HipA